MSSSSAKLAARPPINPQLQHETTLNIPPDPGSSSHSPLTNSIESSNNHNPILNQNGNQTQTVTFSQVLHYWWGIDEHQSNHNIASPTPPEIWMAQNVYPMVTPMRMICFFVSQISFFFAYGSYMQTDHYKTHVGSGSHHHARTLIHFVAANIVNFVILILLMFFSFFTTAYERYLHHYLFKSLGEVMVMLFTSFLILRIGHMHQEGHSEAAGLVTCAFLTIYSLCIITLLKPGHHYSLLDASATLTLHLGLVGTYGIPAVVFIFVILVIKNYIWSHNIGHAQAPTNEGHRLVWFASTNEVGDNLSRV